MNDFGYQQAHPPDSCCDCDPFELLDLRFTSTMSSCFVEDSVSIPGNAAAIFRNRACKMWSTERVRTQYIAHQCCREERKQILISANGAIFVMLDWRCMHKQDVQKLIKPSVTPQYYPKTKMTVLTTTMFISNRYNQYNISRNTYIYTYMMIGYQWFTTLP